MTPTMNEIKAQNHKAYRYLLAIAKMSYLGRSYEEMERLFICSKKAIIRTGDMVLQAEISK